MSPLVIGSIELSSPVILAPMAGVTNAAFRRLCREQGGGLYVTEMVTARALVERNEESMRIISHDEDEEVRSIQLYGVDAENVGKAVKMVVDEDRADHIDLNFGCPVPKVTRKGGGSALPWKLDLFTDILKAAVDHARDRVPITIKMRMGIDDEHLTYLDAGKIAQNVGVAAVALHARTAQQHYSGQARWQHITRLKESLRVPVLGNGDIWSAEDGLAMMRETGCDGIVIGRGCQGRPWLFADLEAAFAGRPDRARPNLGQVCETVYRHGQLLIEFFGSELRAMREIRKHIAWYFKGYAVGGQLRQQLALVDTLEQLRALLSTLDQDQQYPGPAAEGPRGRAGSPRMPVLPEGWLDSRVVSQADLADLPLAELDISGG